MNLPDLNDLSDLLTRTRDLFVRAHLLEGIDTLASGVTLDQAARSLRELAGAAHLYADACSDASRSRVVASLATHEGK